MAGRRRLDRKHAVSRRDQPADRTTSTPATADEGTQRRGDPQEGRRQTADFLFALVRARRRDRAALRPRAALQLPAIQPRAAVDRRHCAFGTGARHRPPRRSAAGVGRRPLLRRARTLGRRRSPTWRRSRGWWSGPAGTTLGLQWEITHLLRSLPPEKLVLWAHPHLLDLDEDEREAEWSRFVDGLGILFPRPLPKPLGATRFFAFSPDFEPIAFGERRGSPTSAQSRALRALLQAKEHIAVRSRHAAPWPTDPAVCLCNSGRRLRRPCHRSRLSVLEPYQDRPAGTACLEPAGQRSAR